MKKNLTFIIAVYLLLSMLPHSYAYAEAMPTWKEAYMTLMMETPHIEEWDVSNDDLPRPMYAYSLYDIDKDGIPELFLHFGNYVQNESGKIYTFRDRRVRKND